MKNFIPALIAPGKHFNVYVHKPDGRPAYAAASEVKLTEHGFTNIPTDDRFHRVMLDGKNTKGNRATALNKLLAEMVLMGWIAQADADSFDVDAA